jgi:hypothetical protein
VAPAQSIRTRQTRPIGYWLPGSLKCGVIGYGTGDRITVGEMAQDSVVGSRVRLQDQPPARRLGRHLCQAIVPTGKLGGTPTRADCAGRIKNKNEDRANAKTCASNTTERGEFRLETFDFMAESPLIA